jgi:hypothetical protein
MLLPRSSAIAAAPDGTSLAVRRPTDADQVVDSPEDRATNECEINAYPLGHVICVYVQGDLLTCRLAATKTAPYLKVWIVDSPAPSTALLPTEGAIQSETEIPILPRQTFRCSHGSGSSTVTGARADPASRPSRISLTAMMVVPGVLASNTALPNSFSQ